MQGYILHTHRVKDEDLIVSILTPYKLKTLYRFYGARHASVHIGYKIDFEAIHSAKSSLPMLREVLPLAFSWIFEKDRFFYWQQFLKLLYKHLKDVNELDSFYFDLLEDTAHTIAKQNPKRTLIESYLQLLSYEGRLHPELICFICDQPIQGELTLKRSFLCAHPHCLFGSTLSLQKIRYLFETGSTIELDDNEVELLWQTLQEGL